jgi:hypothetical protein
MLRSFGAKYATTLAIAFTLVGSIALAQSAPPPPPADLVPSGPSISCNDHETREKGVCQIFRSQSTGIWMTFRQNGKLMFLRNVPAPGQPYINVWKHPSFSSI